MKKTINHHKTLWLILIMLFSFYALSVKFWQGEVGESYLLYTIEILRWFSVWASVIALIWSMMNLIAINSHKKHADSWITSYNFRIFCAGYNLMAGVIFWSGIFTYGWDSYIMSRIADPLSFSVTLVGHLILPILLTIYCFVYSDFYVSYSYYKKDYFLSLIFPALYGLFMLLHSFYWLHQYRINGISIHDHVTFISPYWFLSWFIYGWWYWAGAILLFGVITLVLILLVNMGNNLSLKHRKVIINHQKHLIIKKKK